MNLALVLEENREVSRGRRDVCAQNAPPVGNGTPVGILLYTEWTIGSTNLWIAGFGFQLETLRLVIYEM